MLPLPRSLARTAPLALASAALLDCSASSGGGACYADSDGISGGEYTFVLTVDDTGFSKSLLATQNDAQATVTLTNMGTKPHGFAVGCAMTTAPAGCSSKVCFPAGAAIAPLAPGETKTITFDTPTPDGIIYPFTSNEPDDQDVPGLNDGQWSLM